MFAYLLFIFVAEHGPRYAHGNFYWQLVVSTSFLFAYNIYDYYSFPNNVTFKNTLLSFLKKSEYYIFSSHLVSGIAYILMIIILGKYKCA